MRALKFGFVGIANTILSYILFVLLVRWGVYYLLASALSFGAGTLFSYVMNSKYIFREAISVRVYIRFFVVSILALLMGLGLLYVFKTTLGLNVYVAQIAVVLVRFPIVYIVNSRLVFGKAVNLG